MNQTIQKNCFVHHCHDLELTFLIGLRKETARRLDPWMALFITCSVTQQNGLPSASPGSRPSLVLQTSLYNQPPSSQPILPLMRTGNYVCLRMCSSWESFKGLCTDILHCYLEPGIVIIYFRYFKMIFNCCCCFRALLVYDVIIL